MENQKEELEKVVKQAVGTLHYLRCSTATAEAWQRIPLYIRGDLEALEGKLTNTLTQLDS